MCDGINFGSGEGAFDADEASFCRGALLEARELLFKPKASQFTRARYPKEPLYALHQNGLIVDGMSPSARKELAVGRFVHAKKASVGEQITCPGCGTQQTKSSYQHVFCKDKVKGRSTCKDFINNWLDPVRLARTLERLEREERKAA
jgi:hypothetical protein